MYNFEICVLITTVVMNCNGGTLKAEALTSTFLHSSIQGKVITRPGPLTPCIFPSLKSTILSLKVFELPLA